MWFNSMQREEPYLLLTSEASGDIVCLQALRQVLHGCRQLVLWYLGLVRNGTTLMYLQQRVSRELRAAGDKPEERWGRQSSHPGPYE